MDSRYDSSTTLVEPTQQTSTTHKQPSPPPGPGLVLQVEYAWSKFRNQVNERNGSTLTPLYIQHFRPKKPNLRFESAATGAQIASSVIHNVSISAECTVNGRTIALKPFKRWTTNYNYLSHTLGGGTDSAAVPITWTTSVTMKIWNFECRTSEGEVPIAKFSVNLWAAKEVGNIYFENSKEELSEAARDEVIVTGLTMLYVMVTRMNNPFNILGAAFAKPERVEAQETIAKAEEKGELEK